MGDAEAQGELIQVLLSKLPEDALDDVMPFLMGQILILEEAGDLDEDDIDDMFEAVSNSDNNDEVLAYLQDMDLDIESLSEGGIGDEMIENEEYRSDIMEEWSDMMMDESSETESVINKHVSRVTGEEVEEEDDDGSSTGGTVSAEQQQNLAQMMSSMGGMGMMGMGGMGMMGGMMGMGMMGMGGMGMGGMGMMGGMGAYGFGYAQAITDSIMGGGPFGGGGINVTGNNNVVNVNIGGVQTPAPAPVPVPVPAPAPSPDSNDDD